MDKEKIRESIRDFLSGLGENPGRPGLDRTPERVCQACEEIFGGYGADPGDVLRVFRYGGFDEIVVLKDIRFYSVCEHHLLPFFGVVHIAYIPREGLIAGFSSLIRVVELFSRRLQVQERMTTEIADLLMDKMSPRGVLVQVRAEHLCVSMRGVTKPGTQVTTEALRGIFRSDPRTRAEALSLLGG
ncbi:MAG TPA: GTP cyclohydrolase I FolE [bacterium]|nr:GTP cyclohydrolase I FolE [bacterium]HPJ72009.1 GTP cyclohydrolase I FolE [bacterium]HPQ65460.1 GTP cyclohydrolase I FolE [bacterium]